jgi:glycosyltransferase involved in cell wall biosynthesis
MKEAKKDHSSLSVVIPLYNEVMRLENLSKVYAYLKKAKLSFEVILVNDGSADGTLRKIEDLSKKYKFTVISYSKNRGKGYAIKKGVAVAGGDYILFTDIDLSVPIGEFNRFLRHLETGDILIGSRRLSNSKIKRRQSFLRENLGRIFTFLSAMMLGLRVSDFTCGFKCFPKAAKNLFKKQRIDRWGFDCEILFLAKRMGFKIREIPVDWSNDPKSKVSLPKDIISSIWDLCKIRYYQYGKLYF